MLFVITGFVKIGLICVLKWSIRLRKLFVITEYSLTTEFVTTEFHSINLNKTFCYSRSTGSPPRTSRHTGRSKKKPLTEFARTSMRCENCPSIWWLTDQKWFLTQRHALRKNTFHWPKQRMLPSAKKDHLSATLHQDIMDMK